MENQQATEKNKRGFAAMDPERQRQIAAQGGKKAHQQGVAHEWTKDEARQAARKAVASQRRTNRTENDGRDYIL